jgi:hypothetical protein
MSKPITKAYLLSLVSKANKEEEKRENETYAEHYKRLLIKSSVESIVENVEFNAKLGNLFFKAINVNKEVLLDIYDQIKMILPDCKIFTDINEGSFVIHWGK